MSGFQSKKSSATDKIKEYGMKKVIVRTELMQELEVPDHWEEYIKIETSATLGKRDISHLGHKAVFLNN